MTPFAVEVWRGPRVESRHRVDAVVVDAAGAVRLAIGEIDRPIYPRSAIKPFQALALLETGAADAFAVDDAELALACASHSGETFHVERVDGWLARLGLRDADLACGPHPPIADGAAAALLAAGRTSRRAHNNCSGKHAGMLTVCRHMGWPTRGYERMEHPLQRRIAEDLAALIGIERLEDPGVDGCSLPAHVMPLRGLALAAARLADPSALSDGRAAALRRISEAMRAHPDLVAGTGRACTVLMRALPEVILKTGAEGVFMAALPSRGLGLALKAEDGAGRAAEMALTALLDRLEAVPEAARDGIGRIAAPTIRDANGREVGRIAVVAGWPP